MDAGVDRLLIMDVEDRGNEYAHPAWPLLQCWAYGLGGTSSWDVHIGWVGWTKHTLVNGGQKEEYERVVVS